MDRKKKKTYIGGKIFGLVKYLVTVLCTSEIILNHIVSYSCHIESQCPNQQCCVSLCEQLLWFNHRSEKSVLLKMIMSSFVPYGTVRVVT